MATIYISSMLGPAPKCRIASPKFADPRRALADAATSQGHSYAALSRMLSRRPGYLREFVVNGRPKALTPRDHRLLSDMLGIEIGIRDLWDRDAWPDRP